jgi:hypothetical protein
LSCEEEFWVCVVGGEDVGDEEVEDVGLCLRDGGWCCVEVFEAWEVCEEGACGERVAGVAGDEDEVFGAKRCEPVGDCLPSVKVVACEFESLFVAVADEEDAAVGVLLFDEGCEGGLEFVFCGGGEKRACCCW